MLLNSIANIAFPSGRQPNQPSRSLVPNGNRGAFTLLAELRFKGDGGVFNGIISGWQSGVRSQDLIPNLTSLPVLEN